MVLIKSFPFDLPFLHAPEWGMWTTCFRSFSVLSVLWLCIRYTQMLLKSRIRDSTGAQRSITSGAQRRWFWGKYSNKLPHRTYCLKNTALKLLLRQVFELQCPTCTMGITKIPKLWNCDEGSGGQNSKMAPWFPHLAPMPLSEKEAVTCFYSTECVKGDGMATAVIELHYIRLHLIHEKGIHLKLYYLLKNKIDVVQQVHNWS